MRFVLAFGLCASLLAVSASDLARQSTGTWLVLVILEYYLAVCFLTIAAIYGIREAGFRVEGVLVGSRWTPLIRSIVMPYLALGTSTLYLYRWVGPERAFDPVAPNLLIGRLPFPIERDQLHADGVQAILNLSWEFPRLSRIHLDSRFKTLNLPILDGSIPTLEQFEAAVEWISRCRAEGNTVLIHCAQGHGRSATILAASLVHLGLASGVDHALSMVTAARPLAKPSRRQKLALNQYFLVRAS